MYADPTRIRNNEITIRLSDRENALIDALVEFTGGQRAAIIRELLMEQVRLHSQPQDRRNQG